MSTETTVTPLKSSIRQMLEPKFDSKVFQSINQNQQQPQVFYTDPFENDPIETQIDQFKQKLLSRSQNRRSNAQYQLGNQKQLMNLNISKSAEKKCNKSSKNKVIKQNLEPQVLKEQNSKLSSPSRKGIKDPMIIMQNSDQVTDIDDNSFATDSSMICDKSELLQSRIEHAKRALDHYNDSKAERDLNFTLQSHNISRIANENERRTTIDNKAVYDSLQSFLKTPSFNVYKRQHQKQQQELKQSRSQQNTLVQSNTQSNSYNSKELMRQDQKPYRYEDRGTEESQLEDISFFNKQIALKSIQYDIASGPESMNSTQRINPQNNLRTIQPSNSSQQLELNPRSYALQVKPIDNNAKTITQHIQVPPQSAQQTCRRIEQQQNLNSEDSMESDHSTNKLTVRLDFRDDQQSRQERDTRDLFRLVGDLKSQIEAQDQIITQKDNYIHQILSDKKILEQQLAQCHTTIQSYIQTDQTQSMLIMQKEDEIYRLEGKIKDHIDIKLISQDLEALQQTRDQMSDEIESLRQKLQSQNKANEEDKAKLKEMEELVEVCREQLGSFDSINIMSQQVIEKLERQVNEQHFELEQARDTIERQHEMYHKLLKQQELLDSQRTLTQTQYDYVLTQPPTYDNEPLYPYDNTRTLTQSVYEPLEDQRISDLY